MTSGGPVRAPESGVPGVFMKTKLDKPIWVDSLEECLLLAIGFFALVTWIITIALMAH